LREYTISWHQGLTKQIGEFQVPIPDMPEPKDIINYGLPAHKQFFVRTIIPEDIITRTCSLQVEEKFVEREWHRRRNGVWMYIKGEAHWLPGKFYYFMNYWTCEYGGLPHFRLVQLNVAQFWEMCVADKDCFGMLLIKPRRVGGTEYALCDTAEHTTRVDEARAGMQNMTDDDAKADVTRINKALKKMPHYFLPVMATPFTSKDKVVFDIPSERQTKAKSQEKFKRSAENKGIKVLGSEIIIEATKISGFDGKRLTRHRLGECLKIDPARMNIKTQWNNVRMCISLNNGQDLVGKGYWESTVEQAEGGKNKELTNLKQVQELWEESDPMIRDRNGRTLSGMYRLFIDASQAAKVDEYGYPESEKTVKFLLQQWEDWTKKGKFDDVLIDQRKNPLTIEHALTPSNEQCPFLPQILKERLGKIFQGLDYRGETTDVFGREVKDKVGKFNLIREGGQQDGRVIAVPDPENGRWEMLLGHPEETNKSTFSNNAKYPTNTDKYCMGVDPYDDATTASVYHRSKGACVVFRKFDSLLDGNKYDVVQTTEGEIQKPLAGQYASFMPVAVYVHRHDNPKHFYEDMVMTAQFFGCEMLPETNKKQIIPYFQERGYGSYIMYPPGYMLDGKTVRQPGLASSTNVIEDYMQKIQAYVSEYGDAIHFATLLKDLLMFTPATRKKRDLSVAFGFALIANSNLFVQELDDDISTFTLDFHTL